jgi:hypothetical protein
MNQEDIEEFLIEELKEIYYEDFTLTLTNKEGTTRYKWATVEGLKGGKYNVEGAYTYTFDVINERSETVGEIMYYDPLIITDYDGQKRNERDRYVVMEYSLERLKKAIFKEISDILSQEPDKFSLSEINNNNMDIISIAYGKMSMEKITEISEQISLVYEKYKRALENAINYSMNIVIVDEDQFTEETLHTILSVGGIPFRTSDGTPMRVFTVDSTEGEFDSELIEHHMQFDDGPKDMHNILGVYSIRYDNSGNLRKESIVLELMVWYQDR